MTLRSSAVAATAAAADSGLSPTVVTTMGAGVVVPVSAGVLLLHISVDLPSRESDKNPNQL